MDANGRYHKSCFARDVTGNVIIRSDEEWNDRLSRLTEWVVHPVQNALATSPWNVEHLCYDAPAEGEDDEENGGKRRC